MVQSTFTTRVLTPDEGYFLTQVEPVNIKERIFSKKVFLGKNDSPENWREITEAEAEELIAELNEVLKQEEAVNN